jgi:hypothetical protein
MPTKDPWAIAFELTAKENFTAALEVLDAHFLANDPLASSLRGHIHWLTSKSDADKLVAKDYFTIGANLGRAYDQRELGKLLHELGLTDDRLVDQGERARRWRRLMQIILALQAKWPNGTFESLNRKSCHSRQRASNTKVCN